MKKKTMDFTDPALYVNRELSWLQFNERVLSEAENPDNPLFEQLKFLAITAGNLDEFFMVRVASLKDLVHAGYRKRDLAGMTPQEQLEAVCAALHRFVDAQYRIYTRSLRPALLENGLELVKDHRSLSDAEGAFVDRYFRSFVYPVLTPMAVDSSRPFPLIRNRTLNIGALVRPIDAEKAGIGEADFAMVQVPDVLPRILEIPAAKEGRRKLILLEQVIERNLQRLFLNYEIICSHTFRIGRNADLSIDEDEVADLLKEVEKQVHRRQWGEAIRMEVGRGIDKRLLKRLTEALHVEKEEIYQIDGPLDLRFLFSLYRLEGFDALKEHGYAPPQPSVAFSRDTDIFSSIRSGDILLHHPYESFDPVVRFVASAAADPQVLAIKQTLYRVSGNSPIVAALERAAENGKQVSVLVELKARFDEENNIGWARALEQAGCHVIYGLVGLKTHSKITLVVRREEDGIRRYVHLGTGNYNDSTAKQYTDLGLFTCKETYGEDATAVFNMLSGYSEPLAWNRLSLAPLWLKERLLLLIERETAHARANEEAHIIAKMNSLCHPEVIAALYEASCAGVRIELIVRGICSLRAGIPGVSEHITVRSIVGNFLEHSRIFFFANGGAPEYYLSSADWMPRNLERRVEIMFPVEEAALQQRIAHILACELADTEKAHLLNERGVYSRARRNGKKAVNSQKEFGEEAVRRIRQHQETNSRSFIPETHIEA